MANGLLDYLSGFGSTPPEYLGGLLGQDAVDKLKGRAATTGIANAVLGYLAAPKNQNLGLGRIIGQSLQAGMQGAQGVYDNATQDYMTQQKIADMQRQQQQRDAYDVAVKSMYKTTPAQYATEQVSGGGYLPQAQDVNAMAPNFGLSKTYAPATTQQVMTAPAKTEMNPNALDAMLLSGDPRATAYLSGLKTISEINANPEGAPKVVGRSLVTPSGKVIYTDVNDTGLKAPPTRDRIVNGMTIQETMIGAPTPQNPAGTWKEIGRGERFKKDEPVTFDNTVLDFAAQQYLKTGVMPSLGAGSSKMRQAIVSRASELNMGAGMTAEQGAEQMVANKATSAGILQLQKQKTMVGAFEKNATRNADIALRLSNQADRTGVPVFNSWLQRGQKSIAGNPTVSAFNAANETFVNEYAKIMSGSMGNTPVSDSARQHAHDMLNTQQTPEQYNAVVKILKEEMKNRMIGFEEELKEAKQSLSPKNNANQSSKNVLNFDAQGNLIK